LVRKQVLVVLANWRCLHNGISGEGLALIVFTCELACEVRILSEGLEVISLSPVEVSLDHQRLLFVSIGKVGVDALKVWIFVVPEIDVVLGEVSIRVHHVYCECVELNVLV